MDSAKLEELEHLAKAATPGPWSCKSVPGLGGGRHNRPHIFADGVCLPVASLSVIKGEEDAAFIVAARNAVPELVAENRALQERVRELERQRDYLAFELSSGGRDLSDCDHPHLPCEHRNGYWCEAGEEGQIRCWISVAEQAAKEV